MLTLFLLSSVHTASLVSLLYPALVFHIFLFSYTLAQIQYDTDIGMLNALCALFHFFLLLFYFPFLKILLVFYVMRRQTHYYYTRRFSFAKAFLFSPGLTGGLFPHLKAPKRACKQVWAAYTLFIFIWSWESTSILLLLCGFALQLPSGVLRVS